MYLIIYNLHTDVFRRDFVKIQQAIEDVIVHIADTLYQEKAITTDTHNYIQSAPVSNLDKSTKLVSTLHAGIIARESVLRVQVKHFCKICVVFLRHLCFVDPKSMSELVEEMLRKIGTYTIIHT